MLLVLFSSSYPHLFEHFIVHVRVKVMSEEMKSAFMIYEFRLGNKEVGTEELICACGDVARLSCIYINL